MVVLCVCLDALPLMLVPRPPVLTLCSSQAMLLLSALLRRESSQLWGTCAHGQHTTTPVQLSVW